MSSRADAAQPRDFGSRPEYPPLRPSHLPALVRAVPQSKRKASQSVASARAAKSPPAIDAGGTMPATADLSDEVLVRDVLGGNTAAFGTLVVRHQSRVFATARRYARKEDEIEDIVQEVFLKAFETLPSFRLEAPFEHWLMRVAVRTCYDFLRAHQRARELSFTDLTGEEDDWLERFRADPDLADERAAAARILVRRLLEGLSPEFRLVITLLEIEERSVKEIHQLTGW